MPRMRTGSWRKDRKRGNREIVPTSMLMHGATQLYVQGGQFYTASHVHMPSAPDWAIEIVAAMSKERQEALGFEMKFGKLRPKGGTKPVPKKPEPKPDDDDGDGDEDDKSSKDEDDEDKDDD